MILDTSFVIDAIRGHAPALALRDELESGSDALRIPAVVLFELWEGVGGSRYPVREIEVLEETVLSYPVLALTSEHAKVAGKVSADLRRRGMRIEDADILIAGTALAEDDTLLTRNARDFDRIDGLRIRTY